MSPSKQLVEAALHVLVAWNQGDSPDSADLELLKATFPSLAHLPADELACQVINDLSGRVFPGRDRDSQARPLMDVA